jgi:hypothetical protein
VAQEDKWVLVVHPTMFRGEEKFQYYYVVPDQHLIAWIEELNGYLLFRDCVLPSEWEHKSKYVVFELIFSLRLIVIM